MTNHEEGLINDYAIRCFRDTADRDYIHARLAYHHGLIPQFRWSSLHCLEKYGKCILLLNRITALTTPSETGVSHEIIKSLDRIRKSGKFKVIICDSTRRFMTALEQNASDRYLEYSWHNFDQNINDLDLAIWELRRYCQPLIYSRYIHGQNIDMGPSNLERIESFKRPWDPSSSIAGGWLEKVYQRKGSPERAALVRNNHWFSSSKRTRIVQTMHFQSENSPIDLHPAIRQEIRKYVKIAKS